MASVLCLIFFGALTQVFVVIAMRQHGVSFWTLLPAVFLMQWAFLTAYSNQKAPFSLIWISAAGITTLASFWMGIVVFQDQLMPIQVFGILLIVFGVLFAWSPMWVSYFWPRFL